MTADWQLLTTDNFFWQFGWKISSIWPYIQNFVVLSWWEVGWIKHCLEWGGSAEQEEQQEKYDFKAHIAGWSELARVWANMILRLT